MGSGISRKAEVEDVSLIGLDASFKRFLTAAKGVAKVGRLPLTQSEDGNVAVFCRKEGHKEITCVRGSVVLSQSAEEVSAMLWNFDTRPVWDRFFVNGDQIEEDLDQQLLKMSIRTLYRDEKKLIISTRKSLKHRGDSFVLVEDTVSSVQSDPFQQLNGFWVQKLTATSCIVIAASLFEMSRMASGWRGATPSAEQAEQFLSSFALALKQIQTAFAVFSSHVDGHPPVESLGDPDGNFEWENSEEERRRLHEEFTAEHGEGEGMHWTKGRLLGVGAAGEVYLGLRLDTGELVAVKQITFLAGRSDHISHSVIEKEIDLHSSLQHPNIIKYFGVHTDGNTISIFLEYLSGGSIATLLSKNGCPFSLDFTRRCTRQIVEGLSFLHANAVTHRDIKGQNILVSAAGVVKLTDFGASTRGVGGGSESGLAGTTPCILAPEVIRSRDAGMPADVWALGCVVIEMATGKLPWSECANAVAVMFAITQANGPPKLPDSTAIELREFVRVCMRPDVSRRPRVDDLRSTPFLLSCDVSHGPHEAAEPPPRHRTTLPAASVKVISEISMADSIIRGTSVDKALLRSPTLTVPQRKPGSSLTRKIYPPSDAATVAPPDPDISLATDPPPEESGNSAREGAT